METTDLGRRSILRATAMAGGGLLLGLVPQHDAQAQAPAQSPGQAPAPGGPGRPGMARAPLSPANFVSISPDGIAFPVPANDDASRAIRLYCDAIAAAATKGNRGAQQASGVDLGAMDEPMAEEVAVEA